MALWRHRVLRIGLAVVAVVLGVASMLLPALRDTLQRPAGTLVVDEAGVAPIGAGSESDLPLIAALLGLLVAGAVAVTRVIRRVRIQSKVGSREAREKLDMAAMMAHELRTTTPASTVDRRCVSPPGAWEVAAGSR